MKYVLPTATILLFLFFLPVTSEAAPRCPSNTPPAGTDPACYTQTTGGSWDYVKIGTRTIPGRCNWVLDCKNCFYPCADGSGRACKANYYTNTKSGCPYSRWCDNMGRPPYTTETEDIYGWIDNTYEINKCYYYTVNSYGSCGAVTPSRQYATGVTWHSRSGTSCSNEPLSRYCCNPPTASMTVNGGPSPTTVTYTDTFSIGMNFSTPDTGNGYSCSFKAPPLVTNFTNKSASNVNSVSWIRTGRITDIGPGPNPEEREFTFECTNPHPACPNTLRKVKVSANPEPLSVSISAKDSEGTTITPSGVAEVINSITFTATPSGGVPDKVTGQYSYMWSEDVSGPGESYFYGTSPVNRITKHFGSLKLQSVKVEVTDSWGTKASDVFEVTIQDSRTPQ